VKQKAEMSIVVSFHSTFWTLWIALLSRTILGNCATPS